MHTYNVCFSVMGLFCVFFVSEGTTLPTTVSCQLKT